jgi:hypothetical protein
VVALGLAYSGEPPRREPEHAVGAQQLINTHITSFYYGDGGAEEAAEGARGRLRAHHV